MVRRVKYILICLILFKGGYPGVTTSEGKTWTAQRKFMTSTLSKMSSSQEGKTNIQDIVAREAEYLVAKLKKDAKNGPVQVKGLLLPAVNNVVLTLTTGRPTK